jgi:hypothetical protein
MNTNEYCCFCQTPGSLDAGADAASAKTEPHVKRVPMIPQTAMEASFDGVRTTFLQLLGIDPVCSA